jgi:hypothetical protein
VERTGYGLLNAGKVVLGDEPVIDEERIRPRIYEGMGGYGFGVGGEGDGDDEVCFWVEDGGESERWEGCRIGRWLWAP